MAADGNIPTSSGPGGAPGVPPGFEPAGLGRRFGALLIDWWLSLLVAATFADPRGDAWAGPLVLVGVYALFIGLFGQTPGMAIVRVRCVSFVDGGAIGVPRALLRGLLLTLIIPPVVMDELRRGLHDRAARSIVVAAPRRIVPTPDPITPDPA